MRSLGDTPPRLQGPCTKFQRERWKPYPNNCSGPTYPLSVDGKVTTVPVFDCEQDCLLGSNVLPALGISVVRTNGHPLIASSKVLGQNETVGVNLVQATTKALRDSGVSAFESLISVDSNGYAAAAT